MSDIQMPEGVTLIQDKDSTQITDEVSKLVDKMGIGLNTKINQKSLTMQTQELKSSNDLLKVSGLNSSYLKTLNDFFTVEPRKEEERKKKEDEKNKKGEEKTQEKRDNVFKQGFEKFGTKLGGVWDKNSQSLVQGMLGPLSLITAPLQDFFGFDLGSVFKGMFSKIFTPKKSKTKPTAKDVAKTGDAGSLFVVDQLSRIFGKDKKKGGGLMDLLMGKGSGFLGTLMGLLPLIASVGVIAGTLLTDFFGEGGALELFKSGDIFKGIMTLLFGKDLSGEGTLGKILGIGKQGLKGAAIGFLIGGPIGALIGLAVGAGAGAIKLGFDSGFIQKQFKDDGAIKEFFSGMTPADLIAGGLGATLGFLIAPWMGPAALLGGFALGIILNRKLAGKSAKTGKKLEKTVDKKAGGGISKFFEKIFDGFNKFILNIIPSIIVGTKNKIFGKVEEVGGSVETFFTGLFDDIKEGFNNVFTKGKDIGESIRDIIKKYFTDPLKKLFKSVTTTLSGATELGGLDFGRAMKAGTLEEATKGSKIFSQSIKQGLSDKVFDQLKYEGKLEGAVGVGAKNKIQDALIKGLISPEDIARVAEKKGVKIDSVNDAIIKPNGQIIRTAPDDNIIATKNDPTMVSMGGSKSNSNTSMDTSKLNTMNEWLSKIYTALASNQGSNNDNTMTLGTLLEMSKVG